MSGGGVTDWQGLGILPLQDHEEGVPLEVRQQIVGGRIVKLPDADSGGTDTLIQFGRDHGLGTLGDIHPWFFWQTVDRAERGMGSWAQSFAGMTMGGGAGGFGQGHTGHPVTPAEVLPIRIATYELDGRYRKKFPGWPNCFSALPQGTMMLVLPGMAEGSQQELMLHADPRLIAPNTEGPGECGTLVYDLQPEGEICVDGFRSGPGIDGRGARLQSMMRVVAMPRKPLEGLGAGNAIAWNLALTGVDGLAGYGLCFANLDTAAAKGPITQRPGIAQAKGGNGSSGGRDPHDGDTPCDFGTFSPKRRNARDGLAFMDRVASGPFHAGHKDDQHQIGKDRDKHPINSGHLSTNAYFYRSQTEDGPFFFEDEYPHPDPKPLKCKVHLTWDDSLKHPWLGDTKDGKWRWWAESDTITPKTVPPITQPPGGKTPGPKTPTGPKIPPVPKTPKAPGPNTPGGGPPVKTPGPTTPGPGAGTPPTSGPITGGIGKAPKPFGPSPPVTTPPAGPGFPPRGPGTQPPLLGPKTPRGFPITPPPRAPGPPDVGGVEDPERSTGGPPPPEGSPPAAVREFVGEVSPEDVSLFAIHHPMMESFAEMSFRPQLMIAGVTSFTHNARLDADEAALDETFRPQVLVARAWGPQDVATGDWTYVEQPDTSRARGGTGHGGVLFTPPKYELEDYFSINSTVDVRSLSTVSYVAVAPGVGFALGTPTIIGGLNPKSVVIAQDPTDTTNDRLLISQLNSSGLVVDMIRAQVTQSSGEVLVEIAPGATGVFIADTVRANTVFNAGGSPGISESRSWEDGATVHDVTTVGGIITAWTVT